MCLDVAECHPGAPACPVHPLLDAPLILRSAALRHKLLCTKCWPGNPHISRTDEHQGSEDPVVHLGRVGYGTGSAIPGRKQAKAGALGTFAVVTVWRSEPISAGMGTYRPPCVDPEFSAPTRAGLIMLWGTAVRTRDTSLLPSVSQWRCRNSHASAPCLCSPRWCSQGQTACSHSGFSRPSCPGHC